VIVGDRMKMKSSEYYQSHTVEEAIDEITLEFGGTVVLLGNPENLGNKIDALTSAGRLDPAVALVTLILSALLNSDADIAVVRRL